MPGGKKNKGRGEGEKSSPDTANSKQGLRFPDKRGKNTGTFQRTINKGRAGNRRGEKVGDGQRKGGPNNSAGGKLQRVRGRNRKLKASHKVGKKKRAPEGGDAGN